MTHHVMVFAPAPQLTITIERGAESPDIHLHAGGQGVWQARMIRSLGVQVVLCAVLGGEVGQVLEPLITNEGIDLRRVKGTNSGAYVHDRRDGKRTELAEAPGTPLTRHELDELYGIALAEGMHATVAVLSGPMHPRIIPPDVYRRLAGDLRRNGCRVVADLSRDYLHAVLEAGADFVKVSHEELIRDGWVAGDDQKELVGALRRLRAGGAGTVVVSRAEQPALAMLDQDVMEVRMPSLEAKDPRGAGDSMTAGVAAVIAQGGDLASAIRTGAAAGALNVTRHGLGTGRPEAIARLVDRVELVPLGSPQGSSAEPRTAPSAIRADAARAAVTAGVAAAAATANGSAGYLGGDGPAAERGGERCAY